VDERQELLRFFPALVLQEPLKLQHAVHCHCLLRLHVEHPKPHVFQLVDYAMELQIQAKLFCESS
jgi:hypothetical protein